MTIIIRVKDSDLYIHMAFPTAIFFSNELVKAQLYKNVEEAKLDKISIANKLTGIQLEVIEVKSEVINCE